MQFSSLLELRLCRVMFGRVWLTGQQVHRLTHGIFKDLFRQVLQLCRDLMPKLFVHSILVYNNVWHGGIQCQVGVVYFVTGLRENRAELFI